MVDLEEIKRKTIRINDKVKDLEDSRDGIINDINALDRRMNKLQETVNRGIEDFETKLKEIEEKISRNAMKNKIRNNDNNSPQMRQHIDANLPPLKNSANRIRPFEGGPEYIPVQNIIPEKNRHIIHGPQVFRPVPVDDISGNGKELHQDFEADINVKNSGNESYKEPYKDPKNEKGYNDNTGDEDNITDDGIKVIEPFDSIFRDREKMTLDDGDDENYNIEEKYDKEECIEDKDIKIISRNDKKTEDYNEDDNDAKIRNNISADDIDTMDFTEETDYTGEKKNAPRSMIKEKKEQTLSEFLDEIEGLGI